MLCHQGLYRSTVLRRVPLDKRLTQALNGSYDFKWPEGSGKISFVNDSICIGLGENRAIKWKVFNYKGASLFMYQDGMTPVASIWNQNLDTLNITYHLKPERKVTLIKSDTSLIKKVLLGEWTKYQSKGDYPPPPPDLGSLELNMNVKIDTLSIHYTYGVQKKYWKLTNDASHLYFPNQLISKYDSWEIEHLSKDSLIFKTDYKKRVKWYRKKTIDKPAYSK